MGLTLGVTVVGLPCSYAPDLFLILLNIAVMSPSLLVVVYDFAFYFCRAAGVSKILVETKVILYKSRGETLRFGQVYTGWAV